jgi:hypothetical protein
MSKYEVVQAAKTHGLSGGTHVFTVGQVLDSKDYTVTTISHLLEHGVIRPAQAAKKQKQEAPDASS